MLNFLSPAGPVTTYTLFVCGLRPERLINVIMTSLFLKLQELYFRFPFTVPWSDQRLLSYNFLKIWLSICFCSLLVGPQILIKMMMGESCRHCWRWKMITRLILIYLCATLISASHCYALQNFITTFWIGTKAHKHGYSYKSVFSNFFLHFIFCIVRCVIYHSKGNLFFCILAFKSLQ